MMQEQDSIWRAPVAMWVMILASGLLLGVVFYSGLEQLVHRWSISEEYGYGYMIPVISAFLVWQKKDQIEALPFVGAWSGVLLVVMGLGIYLLGELGTIYVVVQYAFIVTLAGIIFALVGWKSAKLFLVPVLLLFFMVPLPIFLYQGLSNQLQLISSELGVFFIRLFGISVYLEGNVIDLGSYKLQVVEACSGLRYLFPLASLAFIAAYFYKAALWKRVVVFLSSIPITIIMNSFRIGMIGILVEYWGIEQAEGFLHYFEGWVIFMACMAILILEMWVLSKIGRDRLPLREAFAIEFPQPTPSDAPRKRRNIPQTFVLAVILLTGTTVASLLLEERDELIPDRADFSEFPLEIGEWKGKPDRLEQIYLDFLKLDDHVLMNYTTSEHESVGFYVAYYGSQRKGESAHSPRSCLPGGGWLIDELSQRTIDGANVRGKPLKVNRVVIKKGDSAQLVYYWFQQRGRIITNEYLVKWFLFWDSLTRNRSDGALVRLTTFIAPGEDLAAADKQLTDFAIGVSNVLPEYVPN